MIKSPIMQNNKHIDHIVKMTNIKLPTVSLIIFDSISCKEVNINNVPSHAIVIRSNELNQTLEGIMTALIPKISKNEIETMLEKLKEHQTNDKKDKELLLEIGVGVPASQQLQKLLVEREINIPNRYLNLEELKNWLKQQLQ